MAAGPRFHGASVSAASLADRRASSRTGRRSAAGRLRARPAASRPARPDHSARRRSKISALSASISMPVGGRFEEDGAGVGGVGLAGDVADALEPGRGLRRPLLADPEAPPELRGRHPLAPDRLQGEAVDRAGVGMAALGELTVELVDQRAEGADEEQGEFEAGRRARSLCSCGHRAGDGGERQPGVRSRQPSCLTPKEHRHAQHRQRRREPPHRDPQRHHDHARLADPRARPPASRSGGWRWSAGAAGPLHVFDREQLWTVLDGELTIAVEGAPTEPHRRRHDRHPGRGRASGPRPHRRPPDRLRPRRRRGQPSPARTPRAAPRPGSPRLPPCRRSPRPRGSTSPTRRSARRPTRRCCSSPATAPS